MPELPEVEILVRHLQRVLPGQTVRGVTVLRPKVVRPDTATTLVAALVGQRFLQVRRRAKYLLFDLTPERERSPHSDPLTLVGHLGMTGRMYLQPGNKPLPKHAAVTLDLGGQIFIFEDTRYFGRLNLDLRSLDVLGPEPLDDTYSAEQFRQALQRSTQPIKVKLLDQSLITGVGNIYASESLFRARIDPRRPARRLKLPAATRLLGAIREVLTEAIQFGSTVPLSLGGSSPGDGLFYYGQAQGDTGSYEERLRVYDRTGKPCLECGTPIRRCVQAARSTFWCPQCQRG